jgi:antitoxin ParD1/3/4
MARRTLNVSLTAELEALIAQRVESGRYLSASEVVREGLRLLEERDRLRDEALAGVRRKIEEGLASLDRGERIDGEALLAELERRIESRQEPRGR